jgi:hypothetical protein
MCPEWILIDMVTKRDQIWNDATKTRSRSLLHKRLPRVMWRLLDLNHFRFAKTMFVARGEIEPPTRGFSIRCTR